MHQAVYCYSSGSVTLYGNSASWWSTGNTHRAAKDTFLVPCRLEHVPTVNGQVWSLPMQTASPWLSGPTTAMHGKDSSSRDTVLSPAARDAATAVLKGCLTTAALRSLIRAESTGSRHKDVERIMAEAANRNGRPRSRLPEAELFA